MTDKNWIVVAQDLIDTKCRPTDAIIGYVTDGVHTYWINGKAPNVIEIEREDGNSMPKVVDFKNTTFVTELNYILNNFDPVINRVKDKIRTSPNALAKEVWQTVWRLHADKPEDCLATFVELFLYKFLDDLSLMKLNSQMVSVDLASVMQLTKR